MQETAIDPTISTEASEPTFPDWQKTIRRGQTYCQKLIEEEKRHWLDQQMVEEGMLGLQLTEALSYFNISVPPPLENRVVLDRIVFSVKPRGEKNELLNRSGDALHFDLDVAYQLDGDYERERERLDEYGMYTAIAIRHRLNDDDWQQEHGQLADAIDKVTQAAQRFMAKVDGWKTQPSIPPLPSLCQQLETLLREIVRDELMQQDTRRDFGYDL
jgi:hypothetical protein